MPLEFLAIGDPHMDGTPSFLPPDLRRNAFQMVFDQALAYCLEKGIKHQVWLGDIFHGYPPSLDSQEQVVEMDSILHDNGIQLYIIDGNHGYVRKGVTSLSLLKGLAGMRKMSAKIYTGDTVVEEIEGESVAFMPWPNKDISMLDKQSLIFAHVDRPGAKLANGFIMEGVEKFEMGEHEWVMGHNHTPQTNYVGAPLPLKWGDGNKRRFWHLRMQDGVVKKKSVVIDNPYNLEDLWVEKESDLTALEGRSDNTWTRIKLGKEMMSRSKEIQSGYERVVCQPVPRIKVEGEEKAEGEVKEGKPTFMDENEFAEQYFKRKAKEMEFSPDEVGLLNDMLREAG